MKLQSSYLSALPLLLAALEGVNSIPMRFSIVKSSKECLYTNIAASEFITASLFILLFLRTPSISLSVSIVSPHLLPSKSSYVSLFQLSFLWSATSSFTAIAASLISGV